MRGSRFFFILLGVAVLGILAVIFFGADPNKRGLPQQSGEDAPPVPAPVAPPPPESVVKVPPSFDVVRISRNCTAVFAGRATPGSVVVIKTGTREIGRVTADNRGEWVLVPDLPLEKGNQEFVLESQLQGQEVVKADASVVAVVPECQPGEGGEQAIAVLTPFQGASRLLQRPSEAPLDPARRGLALDAVEYDDKGNLILSGRAQPGSTVQIYLNNEPIGVASADPKGRWTLQPEKTVDPGIYSLRVDQVEQAGGKVASRVEMPFSRARPEDIQFGADGRSVVVQPGNSLWRIARHVYGEGMRYTEIYRANQGQIIDPDLIYPGQIFAVPQTGNGAVNPPRNGATKAPN
ncbi:LysM peptidoglycan-binding domain-containing protein [uncultured Ferrovibrio sp.]|uniref:LysM peptidoglycan-binding domain-containing protein n=1 Tax=uncultured Ferrovibrio sp. TaxID=1576913 RepID=UPI00260DB285|nr:LysM peptidoglycan-binding domain-containing protein [uncultured Ferrovibrio sp.]